MPDSFSPLDHDACDVQAKRDALRGGHLLAYGVLRIVDALFACLSYAREEQAEHKAETSRLQAERDARKPLPS